ncbi:MAG: aldo/keto reductase [Bacteroidetes bacterium]|nr:aldo/keto reductase [Bacteroidota bacterium]
MQFKRLGRTGVQVSRLCLGTMNFGAYATEAESHAMMDRALDLGINFFDSANVYGGDAGRGATESIVGNWFALGDGRRERVVLATKVYGRMGDGVNDARLSAYHIRRACEESLRRLRTDHIDLYQMHHIDRDTPWDEIWQAMEILVRDGKVLYVGSSNFAAWNIVQANAVAAQRNFLGLVSEQSIYSLRNRHVELEVLPACRALGVGVIPWSPLGGGILAGILGGAEEGRRARPQLLAAAERLRPQLEAYESLCREIGARPADVALAWVLANPVVTSPIIGPRTLAQLEENAAALDLELSVETMKKLDEIWPGPGNQAPEAYAW